MTDVLHIDQRGAVATLTLDRPERKNALSIELRDAISDALDRLAADESVSCVVVTGRGDVFSAGFDLREFDRAAADEAFSRTLWASSDRYHRTVREFPLPTMAAVNGPAIAGGMDLAVMCDLRIAADTTWFAHPEYTFGDVVYAPLCDLVGGAVAPRVVPHGPAHRRRRGVRGPPREPGSGGLRAGASCHSCRGPHLCRAAPPARAYQGQGARPRRRRRRQHTRSLVMCQPALARFDASAEVIMRVGRCVCVAWALALARTLAARRRRHYELGAEARGFHLRVANASKELDAAM